jgi:predicted nucleic acid-binding protein
VDVQLNGRRAIVTGGSSGIGLATARAHSQDAGLPEPRRQRAGAGGQARDTLGRGAPRDPSASLGAALTAFVDTNVLIRHLTGDPPAMAERATALLASGTRLLLADLVLAECVYVLESFYEVGRERVAELMRAAIAFPSIETIDAPMLLRALEVYEVDRLDFADAYLVAQAEATGVNEILSFDRTIDRVSTVTRLEP